MVQGRLVQRAQPRHAQHGQRHLLDKARMLAGFQPALQGAFQLRQGQAVAFVVGIKEGGQQRTRLHAPFGWRVRVGQHAAPVQQRLDQLRQRARQRRIEAAHFRIRLDAAKAGATAAGIAEQHAPHAENPRILLAGRAQPQAGAVCLIQAPAHARPFDPGAQGGQVVRLQTEARRQRRHVEQVAHFALAAALLRQLQQPLERDEQRIDAAVLHVADLERDETLVIATVLAEDGVDGGRKRVDVGHHHHHVARTQERLGAVREHGQQLVVQHFHFALHAVRHVKFDRAVAGLGRRLCVLGQRTQFTDGHLHLLQQGFARFLAKQVDAQAVVAPFGLRVFVELVEHADEVAPLPAPAGQQRMAVRMQCFERNLRQVGAIALPLALVFRAQQVAPVDDVAPVKAAGVGHGQNHLAVRRQRGQQLQVGAGDVAHAKHHQAARHPARKVLVALQARQRLAVQVGAGGAALLGRQALQHRAPQCRLPALVVRQGLGLASGGGDGVVPGGPGL